MLSAPYYHILRLTAAVRRLAKDTYGPQKGGELSTNTDTDGTDRAGGLPK